MIVYHFALGEIGRVEKDMSEAEALEKIGRTDLDPEDVIILEHLWQVYCWGEDDSPVTCYTEAEMEDFVSRFEWDHNTTVFRIEDEDGKEIERR